MWCLFVEKLCQEYISYFHIGYFWVKLILFNINFINFIVNLFIVMGCIEGIQPICRIGMGSRDLDPPSYFSSPLTRHSSFSLEKYRPISSPPFFLHSQHPFLENTLRMTVATTTIGIKTIPEDEEEKFDKVHAFIVATSRNQISLFLIFPACSYEFYFIYI